MGKSGNPATRAALEAAPDPITPDPDVETDEDEGLEDFDAFWQSRERPVKATTIMGERVTLPPALPMRFELEARKLQRSQKEKDVRKLVAILFGDDALDGWTERGMDLEQFSVLLAWAPQVIAGAKVTLAEVADQIAAAEVGKAPDPT